jgi:senataxin
MHEIGCYDVVVLLKHEYKCTFRKGEVESLWYCEAWISFPWPGSVYLIGRMLVQTKKLSHCGWLVAVGPIFWRNSILRLLGSLISVGSLATTQREYVALHAFCCRNVQMQNAIVQSCLDHFPKYEKQPPVMPDCFTPNFADHLHRTFDGPQLSAIHWSAMHL